jgi:hypothetical protein
LGVWIICGACCFAVKNSDPLAAALFVSVIFGVGYLLSKG